MESCVNLVQVRESPLLQYQLTNSGDLCPCYFLNSRAPQVGLPVRDGARETEEHSDSS